MTNGNSKRKRFTNFAFIVFMLIFLLPLHTLPINAEQTNQIKKHPTLNVSLKHKNIGMTNLVLASTTKNDTKNHGITHEEIVRITSRFKDRLVQQTNDNYMVLKYDTKDALIKSFHDISSIALARKYVDFYYKEYNSKLYIRPTETPAWFVANNSYKKEQVSPTKVKVIQQNQSELFGNYTIILLFKYQNNHWILDDVQYAK